MSRLASIWSAALNRVHRPVVDDRMDRLVKAVDRADEARAAKSHANAGFAAAMEDLAERLR